MGNKIDYRTKKSKKLSKILRTVVIIVFVVIFAYIIIKSCINAYKSVETQITNNDDDTDTTVHFSADEFSSLEELLNAYGCTYISETETDELITVKLLFDRDLYTDGVSNESFFNKLIYLITDFEDYKSFELIDSVRDIDILVTCEDGAIVEIEINGDENYYLTQDSILNSEKEKTEITEFSIDSEELQKLIDNNWNPTDIDLGTKDSTCDGYEIYFDEGFKYEVVGRTIYNMVFTEKYNGEVIAGLNTSSTREEVIEILGEPTFQTDSSSLYGYLGEEIYLFFDSSNSQISIYPVVQIDDESQFIELIEEMNERSDIKQFAMDLTSLWTDYDIYDFDSNYVDLQYTLKGVELVIHSNSLKNGIYIYQNYSGDISKLNDLDNVYIQDTDSVFVEEKERSIDEGLNRTIEGELPEEEIAKIGTEFYVWFVGDMADGEEGYKGPVFYSVTKEYPDTELDRTLLISSYSWYDDYNFVYSVNDDGIYVFNPVSNVNTKIIDIEGEININSAGDGKIVYNDTEEIDINIE